MIDYRYSLLLNKQGYDIKAHIKIDTGMHRLGFSTEDKDKILAAFSLKHIKVAGIFTHLCAADSLEENDVAFTNKQIGSFYTKKFTIISAEGTSRSEGIIVITRHRLEKQTLNHL